MNKTNNYLFSRNSILGLFLIFALSIYAVRNIALFSQTHIGHHYHYNIFRTVVMSDAMKHFELGRWIPEFAFGWGYPIFYFTGPLPYMAGAVPYSLSGDPAFGLNFSWLLSAILAPLSMYVLLQRVLGVLPAVVGSIVYCFSPYRFVDLFVRTNLGETWIFALAPLILLAIWESRSNPKYGVLTGSLALLAIYITHVPSVMILGVSFSLFTVSYILFSKYDKLLLLLRTFYFVCLGTALAAFFIVPAIVDLHTVRGSAALTSEYFSYKDHFVYLSQLLDSSWNYKGSIPGPNDNINLSIGAIPAFLALVGAILSLICFRKSEQSRFAIASLLSLIVTLFLSLTFSEMIWASIPALQLLQFPWRLHLASTIQISLLAGASVFFVSSIKNYAGKISCFLLVLVAATLPVVSKNYSKPKGVDPVPLKYGTKDYIINKGVTTTEGGEFFPAYLTKDPEVSDISGKPVRFIKSVKDRKKRIIAVKKNGSEILIKLADGMPGTLFINQLWFPAWKAETAYLDSDDKTHYLEVKRGEKDDRNNHGLGPLEIAIDKYAQTVKVYFGYTKAGLIGRYISLFAAALLITLICIPSRLFMREKY